MAAGIFEPHSLVDVEEQLTHGVGRELPAFLALKQRSARVAQVQARSIFRQCSAQTLVHIHSAGLAALALHGG